MFGAITIPVDMPRGITLSEFALDVDIAQQMMQVAADNRRSARMARSLGYAEMAGYHEALADNWAQRAFDRMRAFRSCVMERTVREQIYADIMASREWTRFLEPACPDETCDDCERPMPHHIITSPIDTLCPFGRRYWTLARAILWSDADLARMEIHARLAEIAKR